MQGNAVRTRRATVVFALLCLGLLPATVRADEDPKTAAESEKARAEIAAARYARELLVRRALESVRPDRMEEDGVARMREEIKERRKEFLAIDRDAIEQADDLIDGEPGRGLIGEAARLYTWMAHVPPPPTTDPTARLAPPDLRYPVVIYKDTGQRPDFAAFVPRPDEEALPPDEKASLALARRQASARLRSKRLDVRRRADGTVEVGDSDGMRFLDLALQSIRSGKTTEKEDADSMPATRLALTDRHELSSRMSEAYIAARALQVRERLAEFSADIAPSGLVSERAVEEKQERAEQFQADVETLERRHRAMEESLDWLVWAERELASELGSLGYALEEAKAAVEAEKQAAAARAREADEARKAAEAKAADEPDAPKDGDGTGSADDGAEDAGEGEAALVQTPAQTRLVALQLQEGVLKLKMRLLYLTVHRAVLRRQLYDRAIELAKEEARGATDVAERYRSELNRMRRERQLERLDYEETKLGLLLTDATSRAEDPAHANRELWVLWKQALESLRNVNRLTMKAVRLRRGFESKLSPARTATESAPPDAGETADDPLRRFRHPDRVAFDEKYVEDARQALPDPAFDKSLVALHYRVVSERLDALDEALALVADDHLVEAALRREADAADAAMTSILEKATALTAVDERESWQASVTEARKEDFDTTRMAFEETLRGLEEKAAEARSLRDACEKLKSELRKLGPRSFGIRVQRNLDGENLGAAFGDMQSTLAAAGRWVTGQGDDHIGTFLAARWAWILGSLLVVAASLLFVRQARRGLDLAIGRMARAVPALRFEPVTVRAEEAHAKREKAEQDLAAKQAEAEALRLVSKEEAGKAQKMGEGGYDGGAE